MSKHKWPYSTQGRDLVALMLATGSTISVLLLSLAALSDVWIDPTEGLSSQIVSLLTGTLGVLIGGLVGYIGGRKPDSQDEDKISEVVEDDPDSK